jgi:hypothetical protein
MARELVFAKDSKFVGWACKNCGWVKPLGRFVAVGDPIPLDVQAEFDAHDCATHPHRRYEDASQAAARIVREATGDQ